MLLGCIFISTVTFRALALAPARAFAPAPATSLALAPAPALALDVAPALPPAFAPALALPAFALAFARAPDPIMQIRGLALMCWFLLRECLINGGSE